MAILNGIFDTTYNPTELNKRSFAARMLRLYPNGNAPLFAMTSQLGKSTTDSTTHGYFTKTFSSVTTTSTAGDTDAATTLTIGSSVGMKVGMVLHNRRTKENYRITAIPAGSTTVTVSRAYGRITAAALNAADKLIEIGSSYEEGSFRPASRQFSTVFVSNYTQIFRDAWALTQTARASMAEAGYDNVAESRKDCAIFHAGSIEGALIFGQAKMTTGPAGKPLHATQGILDAIEQYAPGNSNTAGATTTYDQLVTLLEPIWTYSTDLSDPNSRVAFCDNTALKVINQIGKLSGQLQFVNKETTFGMQFSSFSFYKGNVKLINHPMFNSLGLTGTMLVMDMPALKLAYMKGRDTVASAYGENGGSVPLGEDAIGGDLLSELAVELLNPYSCGVVDGLTAGAA